MYYSRSINLTLDQEFMRRNYDLVVHLNDNERIDRSAVLASIIPARSATSISVRDSLAYA
ncbi:MAG: hypothetical protein H6632_02550 [Anaerolineales bacterium]|nr:hypothetical protein [Anaerolineales bacterium]